MKDYSIDIVHTHRYVMQYVIPAAISVSYTHLFKGLTCDIYFSYMDVNSQLHIYLPLAITGHDWLFSSNINLFRAKDVIVPYETSTMTWKFRDKEIKIPFNSVEILKILYGEDFMKPKKNAHADPNVYQIPLYERNFRSISIDFCKESNFWEQRCV